MKRIMPYLSCSYLTGVTSYKVVSCLYRQARALNLSESISLIKSGSILTGLHIIYDKQGLLLAM